MALFLVFLQLMQKLLFLAFHNCLVDMGQGGIVYFTASRQISSVPSLTPLITAEQGIRVCCYDSASSETLWTRIKALKGESERVQKKEKSWQRLFENAGPDMISGGKKSILLKMRDGPTGSPSQLQIQ